MLQSGKEWMHRAVVHVLKFEEGNMRTPVIVAVMVLFWSGSCGSMALAEGLSSIDEGLSAIEKKTAETKATVDKTKAQGNAIKEKASGAEVKAKVEETKGKVTTKVDRAKHVADDVKAIGK
jgi:hypothetical protein